MWSLPSRKLRCSSLVHLPLYLDIFLSLSYIFDLLEEFIWIIFNNFPNLNVAYPYIIPNNLNIVPPLKNITPSLLRIFIA